jgi:hypothetical protein
MKIVKLVVGRGSSQELKYGKEWSKKYYMIEAELGEGDEIAQVKKVLEAQLDEWLRA